MKNQIEYRELAEVYDLLYGSKNYKKEADQVLKLIAQHKKSDGNQLLEVGCGSGKHLVYFKDKFSCTGVDVNAGILNVAKKKVKNVTLKKANMITLNLKKKFDVITSLFSAIGYVKTQENLRKTIQKFSEHLKSGGVVIIEPWFTPDTWKVGHPVMTTYQDKNQKIARLTVLKRRGNISIHAMHYLVAKRNEDVKYFTGKHEMGLFEIDQTLKIMNKAGLKSKYLKRGLSSGRGLFIGVKN